MEEEILKAADELFIERGFSLTSTTEIARRAGCTQAMVNYYFRTKSKLFEQIYLKKIEMMFSTFVSIESTHAPFLDKIKLKMEAQFDFLMEHPQVPLFLINELTNNPDRLKKLRQVIDERIDKVMGPMQTELIAEIEAGRVRPILLSDLLLNIISLNLFLFTAFPIVSLMYQKSPYQKREDLLQHRKKENIEIVLKSLQP